MSISNFFATIPGIFSPILAGHLIESKEKSDWNIVFYISSVIFFIGAIFYAFLGSGELQPWAVQASNYNDLGEETQKEAKNEEIKET
jgi:ACS family sodium-dependent inorganic phosphate cotransporter